MVGNDTIHTVTRKEHDCIGYMDVPKDVYWGIHTQRALGNFTVSRIADSTHPQLMRAYATVKRACAEANDELDRVRRDDSEAAGKLADAKVRLAQTSERLRSLKGRVPDLEHRLEASTAVSAEHAKPRAHSSCCACASIPCTSAIRPCWSARRIGPRAA